MILRRVLVPLDGSAMAEQALPQAAAVARPFEAEVLLLRVLEAPAGNGAGHLDSVAWRLGRAAAAAYLERLAGGLRRHGLRVTTEVAEGKAAEEIVARARGGAEDLVVLASHGRGGPGTFRLGKVAQQVLAQLGFSVLVVHTDAGAEIGVGEEIRHRRVMVPLDGSPRAQWALCLAAIIARAHGGELLMVHVVCLRANERRVPPTPDEQALAARLAEHDRRAAEADLREMEALLTAPGLAVRSRVVESGHVVRALEQVALEEGVGLVVMSAHGASGAAPWPWGTVASRMISHGTTPVLVFQDLAAPPGQAATLEPALQPARASRDRW